MRVWRYLPIALAVVLSVAPGSVIAAESNTSARRYVFRIPRQSLDAALKTLAAQSGLQIARFSDSAKDDVQVGPVTGRFTVGQALASLLQPIGFISMPLNERGYIVLAAADVANLQLAANAGNDSAAAAGSAAQDGNSPSAAEPAARGNAPVRPPQSPRDGSANMAAAEARIRGATEEIIVSAQKRNERLQDVPVSLTSMEPAALARRGKGRMEDYFSAVPGLNFTAVSGGQQTLAIRGLVTTALSNTTVAVTIDDVPFGSSTFMGLGSTSYPDIDPSILGRIEVLRGPQGTLYGASSIGGVIKFLTADPTDAFSGKVRIGSQAVEHGGTGFSASGAVNLPLSAAFALQASGFSRQDPGYICNVAAGERDVNQVVTKGGRIAALWRLSDAATLKLNALLQNADGNGTASVDLDLDSKPAFGDLRQSRLPGTERYRIETRLYSASLTASLDTFDLTATTGYGSIGFAQNIDYSRAAPLLTEQLFGVAGASLPTHVKTDRFTQEVRLASHADGKFEWLAGGFFNDERSPYRSAFVANERDTGRVAGTMAYYDVLSRLTEYSLFGNLTVNLPAHFDVQLGARQARIRQRYAEVDTGPLLESLGQESPTVVPTARTHGNAFTYLVTPRFRLSPETMLYARFASGYRPGGPNINAAASDNPASFEPDKTYSYEVGAKGAVLDGALTFDSSIYYIDWKNVQIQLGNQATFSVYTANAGSARSMGAELSLRARPVADLTIDALFGFNDAEVTGDFPADADAIAARGDRLPFSSRFAGTVSIDREIPLGHSVGFVGGGVSYVGARRGEFATDISPARSSFPSYVQVDLRCGMRGASWAVDLFLDNVTDERGILGGAAPGAGVAGTGANVTYLRPRTVGVSVDRKF